MAGNELVQTRDLVVDLDFGQFELTGAALPDPDAGTAALSRALAGDSIGAAGDVVVVVTPHQSNFQMPLRVEVWSGSAPADMDDWQEVFEAHLPVSSGTLTYSTPTSESHSVEVPPNTYRTIISGTGFTDRNANATSRRRGERWRIQLWPDDTIIEPRRLRRWISDEETRVAALGATSYEAPGLLAAKRIRRDLDHADGARHLSGQTESATASFVLPGAPSRWSRFLAYQGGWITTGGGAVERYVGYQFWFYGGDDPEDAIAGTRGTIECQFLELTGRRASQFSWIWLVSPTGEDMPSQKMYRFLPNPTLVHFTLAPDRRVDGAVDTTATIRHSGLPPEWVDDLTSYWQWKLEDLSRHNPAIR